MLTDRFRKRCLSVILANHLLPIAAASPAVPLLPGSGATQLSPGIPGAREAAPSLEDDAFAQVFGSLSPVSPPAPDSDFHPPAPLGEPPAIFTTGSTLPPDSHGQPATDLAAVSNAIPNFNAAPGGLRSIPATALRQASPLPAAGEDLMPDHPRPMGRGWAEEGATAKDHPPPADRVSQAGPESSTRMMAGAALLRASSGAPAEAVPPFPDPAGLSMSGMPRHEDPAPRLRSLPDRAFPGDAWPISGSAAPPPARGAGGDADPVSMAPPPVFVAPSGPATADPALRSTLAPPPWQRLEFGQAPSTPPADPASPMSHAAIDGSFAKPSLAAQAAAADRMPPPVPQASPPRASMAQLPLAQPPSLAHPDTRQATRTYSPVSEDRSLWFLPASRVGPAADASSWNVTVDAPARAEGSGQSAWQGLQRPPSDPGHETRLMPPAAPDADPASQASGRLSALAAASPGPGTLRRPMQDGGPQVQTTPASQDRADGHLFQHGLMQAPAVGGLSPGPSQANPPDDRPRSGFSVGRVAPVFLSDAVPAPITSPASHPAEAADGDVLPVVASLLLPRDFASTSQPFQPGEVAPLMASGAGPGLNHSPGLVTPPQGASGPPWRAPPAALSALVDQGRPPVAPGITLPMDPDPTLPSFAAATGRDAPITAQGNSAPSRGLPRPTAASFPETGIFLPGFPIKDVGSAVPSDPVLHRPDMAAQPMIAPAPMPAPGGGGADPRIPIMVPQLVETLVARLPQAETGPVTILLAPQDLGALRFEVTRLGDALHLHLFVEQGLTLDLLRRHADQLVEDLRQAGFPEASLSFTAGDGRGAQERDDPSPPPVAEAAPSVPAAEATVVPSALSSRSENGRLDLRL